MMHIQPSYHSVLIISKWSTMAKIGLVFVHCFFTQFCKSVFIRMACCQMINVNSHSCAHFQSVCLLIILITQLTFPTTLLLCRKLIQSELLHKPHISGFVCSDLILKTRRTIRPLPTATTTKVNFLQGIQNQSNLSNTQTWSCILILQF